MMEENGKLLEDCVGTSAGIHEEVAKTVEEDVAKERKAKVVSTGERTIISQRYLLSYYLYKVPLKRRIDTVSCGL